MGLWGRLDFNYIPEKEIVTHEFVKGIGYEITVLREGRKERMLFRGYIGDKDIIYTKTDWVDNDERVTKRRAIREYRKAEKYIHKYLRMFSGQKIPYNSAIKSRRWGGG